MSEEAGMYGEFGQALEPVASGSKRKRTMEWAMKVPEADVHLLVDPDSKHDERQDSHGDDDEQHGGHTPKRSRPSPSPKQQPRSIRRKDARYGLSSLNKRQAEVADVFVPDTRPSRFQEGSMSDKPSAQPPSLFTRDHSNNSLPTLANVDDLMTQYHQENSTPAVYHTPRPAVDHDLKPTTSHPLQDEPVESRPPLPFSAPTFDSIPPSTNSSVKPAGGLFRFGKMVASTFNPANVWESFSRTWKESKEDLTVRNIEENRKRAMNDDKVMDDKAMYEQAYQELKKSGQFNFTVVPNKALTSPRLGGSSQFGSPVRQPLTSPRHAAAYARLRPDADFPNSRDTSLDLTVDAAAAAPPQLAALFNPSTEPASPRHLSPEKPISKRKSFFTLRGASLRAPSLSSLKRGRSHANLSETILRTSEDKDKRNPSMSPEKPAHNHLTLQSLPRSQSKKELNRAVKLNKRVSDLESKLADARRELNNAITNASPLPPLPSRFEKFTPTSKSKFTRARFGLSSSKLPSLPSESLIQADALAQAQNTPSLVRPKPTHSQSFDLTHLRSPAQQRDSVIVLDTPRSEIQSFLPVDYYSQVPMDPAALASSEVADQSEAENRPSLDAKLKALDASIKSKTKKTPTKKRKSSSKDDGTYKPPADEEEDELEFVKEKPKKKPNVEPAINQPVPDVGHGSMNKTNTKKQDSSKHRSTDQAIDLLPPGRSSLDTLDPINEEDNIVVAPRVDSTNSLVPSQHDSAISTADAESIHVRTDPLKSILVNKYETVRPTSRGSNKRPSSSQRRSSPPPEAIYTKPTLVAIEKHQIVTATPGVGSVPALPTALEKTTEEQTGAGAGKQQWEWPDDVF
ncbi:hypothetical protein E4T48_07311 [Aureobasidium sp. EXF-10727]|nr:hypothetical protein E4T48_07311 [Aureobasidium sp. EXF-10727]